MIPSINFAGLSEPLVIFGGRMYHPSNSSNDERDYFFLSNLRFPLRKGQTLEDFEKRYVKLNAQELEKTVKAEAEALGQLRIDFLNKALSFKEDLMFFFKEICVPYEKNTHNSEGITDFFSEDVAVPEIEKTEFSWRNVLPAILSINCALVNRRMYPLVESQKPDVPFANINQKKYEIRPAVCKAEDIEAKFLEFMTSQLKNKGLHEFTNNLKKSARMSELEKKIGSIELLAGVKKLTNAYEYGDIGYDFALKVVYWLIPAHYNYTAVTSYGDGLSAVTLKMDKKKLANTPAFAFRNSINDPFIIHRHPNCYGGASRCLGDTVDDIMAMLRACRMVVINEGRFYQEQTSSSDDSSNY